MSDEPDAIDAHEGDDAFRCDRTARQHRSAPLVVGSAVGIPTLVVYLIGTGRGLDYDSSVTVGNFVANHDLWSPFQRQIVFNNHPMFSFLDHLVYLAGGRSEFALTFLPALCGALGAAVLAGWLSMRTTTAAAITAGIVLAANPTYAALSRSIRGYTLMSLCLVVATILVLELRTKQIRLLSVGYVVCMAVAIGTHLYAGIALLLHVVIVLADGRISWSWIVRWSGAGILGLAPYRFIAASMLDGARARPKAFHPDFPEQVVRMALGSEFLAVGALLPLVAVGCWRLRRSRAGWAAAVAVAVVLGVLWLVIQPYDLYPRFLLPLAAAAAAAVAVAVVVLPKWLCYMCVAIALAAMGIANASRWTDDSGFKAAAGITREASAQGNTACVGYFYGEAFQGYGIAPRPVSNADELAPCDVLFLAKGVGDLFEAASRQFPHSRSLGDLVAYARADSAVLLEAPPAAIP